jgi:hypothetical protein
MQRVIMISQENLDYAFGKVKQLIQDEETKPGLNAPFDSTWIGKIESAWSSIQSAIQKAFIYGKEAIKDAIDGAVSSLDSLLQQAGTKVKEIHNEILKRLQLFIKSLIDNAISLIPSAMNVGEAKFEITKINYAQKLVLGGSLKANLLEIISLTSNGELELSVEYAKASVIQHI